MKNTEVVTILNEIADLLEIQDVEFKPRAYRRAARNIEALNEPIEDIHARGDLQTIDGVGDAIAEKITEYLETGTLAYYEDLKADAPMDLTAITRVEGIGPKRAKQLYDALEITSLDDLEAAATAGKIAEVEGFGEKSQQSILDHLDLARKGDERMLLGHAFPIVAEVVEDLRERDEFDQVHVAGSFRRRRPTVGDIDLLATAPDPSRAMDHFITRSGVVDVLSTGDTRSSVRVRGGLQMDLRIVDPASFGAALQYFTGSKDHNITVRNRAIQRDWKLNEYGLFAADDTVLAGDTEADVYEALDLAWIPPELREATGEVDAAATGSLPDLVTTDDIRGDLQMHTEASDGSNTVMEMAEKAIALGYEYILITDHGPSLRVAGGLSREEFDEQRARIDDANDALDITVLHGIEANVTPTGLDVSPEWCAACDIVVIALHDRIPNPTEGLRTAIEDYPVDIVAHPQNRMLNQRKPLDIDLNVLVTVAAANNVALEINAQPNRLDLDWAAVKEYRDTARYVISTDAHVTSSLEYMHFGVSQARRGWCEPRHILNTRPVDDLLEYFHG